MLALLARGFENYEEEYKSVQRIVVGLDNQDMSIPANMLVNNFKNTEHFADLFELASYKEDEFKTKLKSGEIDAGVIMPEGFADALYHFENKPIHLISRTSTPIKNAILEETLSGYAKYVKAVDMACYCYNNLVEKKETNPTTIEAYEKGITVDLLYASLNRGEYFDKKPLSEVKIVSSTEYYFTVMPFSILTFISLIGAFKRIKERHLSIQKRIKISGISTIKLLLADYVAECLFILIIFLPLIIYNFWELNIITAFKFTLALCIASFFFSSLWKVLSHLLKKKENLLIFGISISFLNALVAGAIVPYVLLNQSIKNLGEYSLNFSLSRYTMGMTNIIELIPFIGLLMLLFLIDLRLESRT